MDGTTTDPNDPRLTRGVDDRPTGQAEVYLRLSEEERAKGFVRPLRRSYVHVGHRPKYPLRELTDEEKSRHTPFGYVAYEKYPDSELPITGRFWTQKELDAKACGVTTTMGIELCETYARNPGFYGSTYCCGCNRHLSVNEFRWAEDGQVVGS